MTGARSNVEILQGFRATMGDDFGAYYASIYDDCIWLKEKWRQYRELFGTSAKRVELLNEAAPHFFSIVHDQMFEGVLMHLCRITDPKEMGGKQNLCLSGVVHFIQDAALRLEIEMLVSVATEKVDFARDWRNRQIAHRDKLLALEAASSGLAHASRLKVEEAIEAISRTVVRIHQHYICDTSLDLSGVSGDAQDLLRVLHDGVALARARSDRFAKGEPTEEDWSARDAI